MRFLKHIIKLQNLLTSLVSSDPFRMNLWYPLITLAVICLIKLAVVIIVSETVYD